MSQCPQDQIVGTEASRVLFHDPLRTDRLQFWCNCSNDNLSNFVLYGENILKITVKAFGPKVITTLYVYELSGHTNSIARFSNTAFQNILSV